MESMAVLIVEVFLSAQGSVWQKAGCSIQSEEHYGNREKEEGMHGSSRRKKGPV
jgi:hypothetical protein